MFQPDKLADLLAPVTPVQDPFSLDALIAWLRTKPGDEEYNWYNCSGRCLLSQFVTAMGAKHYDYYDFVAPGNGSDFYSISSSHPQTMGAALDRALAIRARRS